MTAFQHPLYPFTGTWRNVNGQQMHALDEGRGDTVIMLHRPGRYDGGQEDNVIEVIIAKQRNGPTGDLTLAFLKQYMRFENYAGDGTFGIN